MNQADTRQGAKKRNGAGGIRTLDTLAGTPDFKGMSMRGATAKRAPSRVRTSRSRRAKRSASSSTRHIRPRVAETRQTRRILAQRAQLRRLIRLHPGAVFSVYTTGDTLQLVGAHGIAQEWWGGTLVPTSRGDAIRKIAALPCAVDVVGGA